MPPTERCSVQYETSNASPVMLVDERQQGPGAMTRTSRHSASIDSDPAVRVRLPRRDRWARHEGRDRRSTAMTRAATAAVGPSAAAAAAASLADSARPTDNGLVRRWRGGDLRAWIELLERSSGYVYGDCRLLRSERRSRPGRQSVRIYAEVHAAGHPADPGALKPWIAQLARRVAVDRPAARCARVALRGRFHVRAARGARPDRDRAGHVASRISRGLVMLRRALEEEAQPAGGGDVDA
jgi:hypothetical protein